MVKTNLRMMKVLDVQWGYPNMPDDVKSFFFEQYKGRFCNDVWVEHCIELKDDDGEEDWTYDILDQWLLDNTDVIEAEDEGIVTILLKHWW